MTEEEAKARWCPFVRIARMEADDGASWNRLQSSVGTALPKDAVCAGSSCMAWRWSENATEVELTTSASDDIPPPPPIGEGWTPAGEIQSLSDDRRQWRQRYWKRPRVDRNGFCGLAGVPQ